MLEQDMKISNLVTPGEFNILLKVFENMPVASCICWYKVDTTIADL